jgi:hypothetical protein
MLKTVIIPNESVYSLPIPNCYIGKKLEVLLYSQDEFLENKTTNNKKPSDYFGTLSATEGDKFQEYITNFSLRMEQKYLIDTNVLIDVQIGKLPRTGRIINQMN